MAVRSLPMSLWICTVISLAFLRSCRANVIIDASGNFGQTFDGIGAISGGGPHYGASLHILKVEIGGDSQSTEGTEASHMHTADDISCRRGYEGWLMAAAKKIWNERQYNIPYIKTLRKLLNKNGLEHVKIIASDAKWGIAADLKNDKELADSVYAVGTIAWNAVAAYFDTMPYPRCSLMTANEPWSGHYDAAGPIWITAHTTQFVDPGWVYLGHGTGVGHLAKGGSYVSLISPDKKDITVIIETMTHEHSGCIRPPLAPYIVQPQQYTFQFVGLPKLTSLHVWTTKLRFGKDENSDYFIYLGEKSVTDGMIRLNLDVDQVVTLSTRQGHRPRPTNPPPSVPLPLPYTTDFELKEPARITEPEYLTPQAGYFEIVPDPDKPNRSLLQQMVLQEPIQWCYVGKQPLTIMGYTEDWRDIQVEISASVPHTDGTSEILLAARIDQAGCDLPKASGIFAWFDYEKQQYRIAYSLDGKLSESGPLKIKKGKWYTFSLAVHGDTVKLLINGKQVARVKKLHHIHAGFAGLGCGSFATARYRSFTVRKINEIR